MQAMNTHIGMNKMGCKDHYGTRFDAIKRQGNRKRVQKCKKRIGNKILATRQKKEYANNPQNRKKNSNEFYNRNKETIRIVSRDRAREKRFDCNANLAKFHQETEFGPELIFICCHASLDENEVLEMTSQRKEKIRPDLYEDCCFIKTEEFHNPREKGRYSYLFSLSSILKVEFAFSK